MLVLRAVLVLLVASVSLPGLAHAELSSGSLSELASKAAQEEQTQSTATTPANGKQETETNSSIPGTLALLGVAAIVVLLGGIAFVIVRDARSAAPVADGAASGGGGSRSPEVRLRKRRAKAKAARQQRKRNR
ncbi:MAG TPA: hypothetical protein VGI76_10090 [Solirubrobacteraceae bacterium]